MTSLQWLVEAVVLQRKGADCPAWRAVLAVPFLPQVRQGQPSGQPGNTNVLILTTTPLLMAAVAEVAGLVGFLWVTSSVAAGAPLAPLACSSTPSHRCAGATPTRMSPCLSSPHSGAPLQVVLTVLGLSIYPGKSHSWQRCLLLRLHFHPSRLPPRLLRARLLRQALPLFQFARYAVHRLPSAVTAAMLSVFSNLGYATARTMPFVCLLRQLLGRALPPPRHRLPQTQHLLLCRR